MSAVALLRLGPRFASLFPLALCLAVGACSDSLTFADLAPQAPKFEFKSLPSSPVRVLGPPTLIGPDGNCAAAAAESEFQGGGIALQMSECDVVQRAGPPDGMDFSTNARGERAAVLTYTRGERSGVYRFVAGRLVSVERGPEPPAPERPGKKGKAKPRA